MASNIPIDITGQRFGSLVVLRLIPVKEREGRAASGSRWLCQCDCGAKKEARGNVLRLGQVRSCGCLRASAQQRRVPEEMHQMVGRSFGHLKVISALGRGYQLDTRNKSKMVYECLCSCGNVTNVRGSDLRNGTVKSCGCLKTKKGRQMAAGAQAD